MQAWERGSLLDGARSVTTPGPSLPPVCAQVMSAPFPGFSMAAVTSCQAVDLVKISFLSLLVLIPKEAH